MVNVSVWSAPLPHIPELPPLPSMPTPPFHQGLGHFLAPQDTTLHTAFHTQLCTLSLLVLIPFTLAYIFFSLRSLSPGRLWNSQLYFVYSLAPAS
jgi:hypothetical protein